MSNLDINQDILLRNDSGHIATLTLNRPRQYNALSEELLESLHVELKRIAEDENIRVVVIAAAGKAFCPGHDLKQMRQNHDERYYRSLFVKCSAVMNQIIRLPQPVIAKVQGMATAAGCQLVATCDLAVAAEHSRFAVSGITVGLFCSTPSVALSRNVPRKKAMEMLLTGEFVDAETAMDLGLLNHVCPEDELDKAVLDLAAKIAAKPPGAVQLGKKLFYSQMDKNMEDALKLAGEVMACNLMQPDTIEGVDAFLEKRKPDWR